MPILRRQCLAACLAAQVFIGNSLTATPVLTRAGNTSLRMPPIPLSFGYSLTNAFGNLTFLDPVAIVTPPGETNRLFVAEQRGRVAVITNLASPTRTVFLDISPRISGGTPRDERGLLGLAFHPGYATNGLFFLYYSTTNTTAAGSGLHEQLSRFEVSPTNANAGLVDSEVSLLSMYDEAANHNGGDLHFGPDGLLYVALGDEGGANDAFNNSQRIDKDFRASMLRLDVDVPYRADSLLPHPHPANTNSPDGEIHYRIPADNPFVGATNFLNLPVNPDAVRTEMYAVGLRNPWRFSFDPATGELYCGDVGQNAWEEIDLIVRGGNYGWAFREGFVAGPKAPPVGFTSVPPLLAYFHGNGTNQGLSITGGLIYRGDRLPALRGAYVFADYINGNFWSVRFDGTNATGWVRLTVDAEIAAFGCDPINGDVLVADQGEDTIKRLVFGPQAGQPLPPSLAETGVFADPAALEPADGFTPYEVNVSFWSDHAEKTRWFYVPTNFTLSFQPQNAWLFPTGSVWVKHFELELTNGVPESRRRIETRLLVRMPGSDPTALYGATYRWGESATNALLVAEDGLDEPFLIDDGAGVVRTQIWHYPGRSECLQCHTRVSGRVLGFNAPQLNREVAYGSVVTNQLQALSDAGYFTQPIANPYAVRATASARDESVSVEQRVRSFLAVNCSPCHQPGGTALGVLDALLSTSLPLTRLVNGPLADNRGDALARLVVPGSLDHSMILQRLRVRGPGQMPPLSSTEVDEEAVALVSRWITEELPGYQTFTQWQTARFGSSSLPEAQATADPDGDGASNFTEYLTGTSPTVAAEFWGITLTRTADSVEIGFPVVANRLIEVQWSRDLADSAGWQFLAVPGNRPFCSATNGLMVLTDSLDASEARLYRARVSEP